MRFITFGNSATMGDAQFDQSMVAAKKVLPEFLLGFGLKLVSTGLLGWGVISGLSDKKASVLNVKTFAGAGLIVVSEMIGQDTVNKFEADVSRQKALTFKV
jgi:hypothetical protein